MTHDPAEPSAPLPSSRPPSSRLRLAVIVLAGVEIFLVLGILTLFGQGLSSNEELSRTIAQGVIVLTAGPLAALAVPALILGIKGRALKTAFALTLLALLFLIGVVFFT